MSTKLTDPGDLLDEMAEPIKTVRGAHDALLGVGDELGGLLTEDAVRFIANGLWPAIKRLQEISDQWEKLQRGAGEKED